MPVALKNMIKDKVQKKKNDNKHDPTDIMLRDTIRKLKSASRELGNLTTATKMVREGFMFSCTRH